MSTAVATRPTQSLLATMADKVGMDPKIFVATIKATCFSSKATDEEFAAFMLVASKYELDPITKEIYAFPKKGGGIQPVVGVDGWIHLANSHPAMDGMEFEDILSEGKLVAIKCRVHRKDRSYPTEAVEYMEECRRATDPWKQWPIRMLRHKALIQASRIAFGFSGFVDPDEAERMLDSQSLKPTKQITTSKLNAITHKPAIDVSSQPAQEPDPVADEYRDAESPLIVLQAQLDAATDIGTVNQIDDDWLGPEAQQWATSPKETEAAIAAVKAARARFTGGGLFPTNENEGA